MAAAIPLGQPILIGHHSEGRDRRYRGRIQGKYEKAYALQQAAQAAAARAEAVGSGGISSDDPDAIEKLREQLAKRQDLQLRMKAANAAIRRNKGNREQCLIDLQAQGLTPEHAAALLKTDITGRIGFPAYALTNNNGNIARIKARIAELERASQREEKQIEHKGFEIIHNTEDNRVQIIFPGKPAEPVRALLKSWGFRWAPSAGAWQRHLNNAGINAASLCAEAIEKLGGAQ
jgi:hypothetical protein